MKINEHLGLKISFSLAIVLIVLIGIVAVYLIYNQTRVLKNEITKKGETLVSVGSQIMEFKLEMGVELDYFTVEEAFDSTYTEIAGTNPQKYHSTTDVYFDQNIKKILDSFLKDKAIIYAILVDKRGYCPTHNTIFSKPLTGDFEVDLAGNRRQRIFADEVGLKAATNTNGFLKQIYKMDTGEILWDLSFPVDFMGEHWGAFRIGYSIEEMDKQVNALIVSLIALFVFLVVLLSIIIFLSIHRAMRELVRITNLASLMADGDISQEIQARTKDEIGRLANVLERMRTSLKLSIDTLKKRK